MPDNQFTDGIFKPTELNTINALNMKAKKISSSERHSLVLFEDKSGKEFLYSLGISNYKYLGVP